MGARAFQGLVGHAGWACRATFADSRLIKELNHQQHRSGYGPHARQVALATLYTEGFSGFVTSTAASNATGWLTLQDSRPHVLFGTVLVKHLLDLISSFPQPV